jgi:hypothetical protein
MKPIRTAESNMVYVGPSPEVGDLHCQRVRPGLIRSIWRPSAADLAMLNAGGNVYLEIMAEPIPPVALGVTIEDGIGEDSAAFARRLELFAQGNR